MVIIGVAAYGSRARNDGGPDSDVDLLGVTTGAAPSTVSQGKVTISSYPLRQLVCRAGLGDLFVLHIASEAKVLYEAWPVFEQIRQSFRYKSDYAREIRLASDAGWFLARHGQRFPDPKRCNDQMAWCTRTILIAKAANERRAVFASRQLAEYAGSPDVRAIIDNKDNAQAAPQIAERFRAFLAAFGTPPPAPLHAWPAELARFEADGNRVGARLVRWVTAAADREKPP